MSVPEFLMSPETPMTRFNRTLLPCLFTALFSMTAHAGITADAGITSEFVRDGISQTGGNLAWQAGLTATHPLGIYGGLWGSNVNHGSDDSLHSEWDFYGGMNFPIWRRWSGDASITRFTFQGDGELDGTAYTETAARLLWKRNLMLGYRYTDSYFGSNSGQNVYEVSYTFQPNNFSIELHTAWHKLTDANEDMNFGGENTDDYWHFRVGVARTWNHWDYRLTLDRTNLGYDYDAATSFQFSVHRFFTVW